MKTPNGYEVIQLFEQFSPKHLAMEWDKIGLQIGTLNKPIKRIMVTLDVLESVVDEAIVQQIDLIIAHHPPIFRPMKHVTDDTAGRIVTKCIKNDIAVYAAHTNLDVATGGMNDWLAELLELQNTCVLVPTYEEKLTGEVLGAGRIGELASEMNLDEFAEVVKFAFDVPMVRIVGSPETIVKKVAIVGGNGNDFIYDAKKAGADVYITGDMSFHIAHDCIGIGLSVIDPGHHVEKVMKKGVSDLLTKEFTEKKWTTDVCISIVNTEPFRFV